MMCGKLRCTFDWSVRRDSAVAVPPPPRACGSGGKGAPIKMLGFNVPYLKKFLIRTHSIYGNGT